jgi:hypothetical protein
MTPRSELLMTGVGPPDCATTAFLFFAMFEPLSFI